MPKIALYVPTLAGGGAERVFSLLSGAFADREISVDLLVGRAHGPFVSQISPKVRTINFDSDRVGNTLPKLTRYLTVEQPDVLLSAMTHANLVALMARRLARTQTRVAITEHSILSETVRHSRLLRSRVMPVLARRIYPWADVIIGVSDAVAGDVSATLGISRQRIAVVYNPAVTPELYWKADEPVSHPWFAPGEVPVMLGVGRLDVAKDFPTLIRAFASARTAHPMRLVILGDGPERSSLEELVRKLGLQGAVHLAGFVENPFNFMRRAAMLVLSSRWEGFGNVLAEAMALGTPVVATDCPGAPREILGGGVWGNLVPVGDSESLASAIQNTLKMPIRAETLQERAKLYSVEIITQQYLELLLGPEAFRKRTG